MGRNEIRLRRKRTISSGADRYRNYSTILERHEREQRLKKILKVFVMFIAVLILIMIITMLGRWEKRSGNAGADLIFGTSTQQSRTLMVSSSNTALSCDAVVSFQQRPSKY